MVKRRYLITFCMGTELENRFTVVYASDKDTAQGQAFLMFGLHNVGRVYVDNDFNRSYLGAKGYKII